MDGNGQIITCPRKDFSEAFQRRIRVRGMTVNDLTEFSGEIVRALKAAEGGKDFSWSDLIGEEVTRREDAFKAPNGARIGFHQCVETSEDVKVRNGVSANDSLR